MIVILILKKSQEIKCLRILRCSYLVSEIFLYEKKMVFIKKKKKRSTFSAHLFTFCLLTGERKKISRPLIGICFNKEREVSNFLPFSFKLIGCYLVNWRLVSIAVKWRQSMYFCNISK